MLTITEIIDALESGKMLVGHDVETLEPLKAVLGNTIRDWETGEGAHILIHIINHPGEDASWGDSGDTYEDDFDGGWFNPKYYAWTSVEKPENLTPLGFALNTAVACNEEWDSVAHWDAQQAKMGLPR